MSLVSLAFATILISPTDIPVPPLPAFSVGHFSKSTFKITVNQPGKDKPMVIPGKMERKDVRSEEKGVRVVTITLDVPEGGQGKSNFELKFDASCIPLGCKELGEKASQDGMNALMLMFQEPLWPKAKAASGWKATLPNQDDAKQPILVDCKAELDKDGTIVLTQKLTQTKELVSAGLKLESVLRINAKTGKVKSVHESIAVKSQGGPDMTILFDIQS